MFWSAHGNHVERELSETQMNPGDIVVQEKDTTVGNDTSYQSNSQPTKKLHPNQDENMTRFANRFEKQMRQVNIANGRCKESGGNPEEKQRTRSTRKSKGKTRVAHGKRGGRDYRNPEVSTTDRYKPRQERSRRQGRPVEMRLDRIVLNGTDQPFPSGTH